jgi:hypothetical protein
MKNVLITGDSHAATIWQYMSTIGKAKCPYVIGDVSISVMSVGPGGKMKGPFFDAFPEHVEFNRDELRCRLDRLPPAGPHFDAIGISGPLLTIWSWSKDWRKFTIDEDDGPDHFVSRSACECIFADLSRYMIELVEVVRRTREVFVIEPPAPFRHHQSVRINGPNKVVSVFRRHNSYLKRAFSEMNVPVVCLEDEWLDSDGFMRPEYRRSDLDTHHGNAELGGLMLGKICDHLVPTRVAQPLFQPRSSVLPDKDASVA